MNSPQIESEEPINVGPSDEVMRIIHLATRVARARELCGAFERMINTLFPGVPVVDENGYDCDGRHVESGNLHPALYNEDGSRKMKDCGCCSVLATFNDIEYLLTQGIVA